MEVGRLPLEIALRAIVGQPVQTPSGLAAITKIVHTEEKPWGSLDELIEASNPVKGPNMKLRRDSWDG